MTSIEGDKKNEIQRNFVRLIALEVPIVKAYGVTHKRLKVSINDPSESIRKNNTEAQRILGRTKADIIVWGFMTEKSIKLFFCSGLNDLLNASEKPYKADNINELELPKSFIGEIHNIILIISLNHLLQPEDTHTLLRERDSSQYAALANKQNDFLRNIPPSLLPYKPMLLISTALVNRSSVLRSNEVASLLLAKEQLGEAQSLLPQMINQTERSCISNNYLR